VRNEANSSDDAKQVYPGLGIIENSSTLETAQNGT
jgi:leucyl-tRNA synthetase